MRLRRAPTPHLSTVRTSKEQIRSGGGDRTMTGGAQSPSEGQMRSERGELGRSRRTESTTSLCPRQGRLSRSRSLGGTVVRRGIKVPARKPADTLQHGLRLQRRMAAKMAMAKAAALSLCAASKRSVQHLRRQPNRTALDRRRRSNRARTVRHHMLSSQRPPTDSHNLLHESLQALETIRNSHLAQSSRSM